MTIYASGSIRFNGLGGDTNFDEMIGKLARIESRQVNQLMRWRSDWQTRLAAFKQVRSDLMELQSSLTRLNSMNKFMIKTAVSSDDKVATATADASAIDTTYSLRVDNLAKAYTWSQHTGLHHRTDVIANQSGGGTFEYTYKGVTRTINVPENTTAEGLVRLINNDSQNPGARAQLVQTGDGITFQMFGMETGRSNTLVIRKADGLALNMSASALGNYDDTQPNRVQLLKGFTNPSDIINPSTENKTFNYTVDGQSFRVTVTPDMTLQGLVDAINIRHPGLASRPQNSSDNLYYFTLDMPDTTFTFGSSDYPPGVNGAATQFTIPVGPVGTPRTTDIDFTFSITSSTDPSNPNNESVTITPDMTVAQFRNALQAKVGGHGTVSVQEDGTTGEWIVDITPRNTVHRVTVEDGTLEDFAYKIPADPFWNIVEGENARIKVNDWPGGDVWFESASNTIAAGTIVEGVSFRLMREGETTITTGTDTAKIKENIESFVDAVNKFRIALRVMTQVDQEKQTWDPRYAESQFEMQKGSVLTGNYGIQTIESRLKMAIAGAAIGFTPRQYAPNGTFLSGDIFSSLSQIGITTNADQGGTFFGLLQINEISGDRGSKSLDDALRDDPMAVARLFAANNEGFTDSASFGYSSQIATVTKAGNYSVRYTVVNDGTGNGRIDRAWINGEEANIDHANSQITSVSGPSRGLVLDIYPHSLVPGTEINGTVSLREGKVNELLSMLDGSEGMLGTRGTLRNLERNYQEIIDNIEKKITREDERLARWERTMINKFARLDAVLARYNMMNEGLQSQIAQLGVNNKK